MQYPFDAMMYDVEGILPEQMANGYLRPCLGERLLLAAVLQDAVELVTGARTGQHRDREEASRWIASDRAVDLMDFVRICEMLGLDHARVREAAQVRRGRYSVVAPWWAHTDARRRAAAKWKAKQRRRVA